MNMPHLTPDVSFGHILTAVSMLFSSLVVLVAVAIAWANLRNDVDTNTSRIVVVEKRTEVIPERLARIEAILERMDRRGTPAR